VGWQAAGSRHVGCGARMITKITLSDEQFEQLLMSLSKGNQSSAQAAVKGTKLHSLIFLFNRFAGILSILSPLLIPIFAVDLDDILKSPYLYVNGGGALLGSFLVGGLANKIALLGLMGLSVAHMFILGGIIGAALFNILSKHAPALAIRLLNWVPVV